MGTAQVEFTEAELLADPDGEEGRKATLREVEHWCHQRPNGADLLAEFHAVGEA